MKENKLFDFDELRSFVTALAPQQPVDYVVEKSQQKREIESLKETLGGKRFMFVNNLEKFEIEEAHGIERWLGYSPKDFTMRKYLDGVVHPGKRRPMILFARQIYESLCRGQFKLSFMVQRYSSQVALKHYNGGYLLANKISSVFQYDRDNRLTAYLNEFTITGPYENEPMQPDFFTSTGEMEPRGREILEKTLAQFLELRYFSEQELQLARKLAYSGPCTIAQIAAAMNIAENTAATYCKRFLPKAKIFFHLDFGSALEAAIFMRKEGLL